MSFRTLLLAAAVVMGAGVMIGAFGAHGLEKLLERLGRTENLTQRAAWLETGARYQLYHGLALLGCACLARGEASRLLSGSGAAFLIGVLLFSGSLYAMTLGPATWKKLGMVTPLGGLSLIIGWALLAAYAWTQAE